MAKITETTITQANQDSHNANKGTERGEAALDDSLTQFGAGRSLLLDKNNNLIAGNKTQKAAIKAGLTKMIVVETTGDEVVAVKRMDMDLSSETDKRARQLAYYDNEVQILDYDRDLEQLIADLDNGVDLTGLWNEAELAEMMEQFADGLLGDGGEGDGGIVEDDVPIDKAEELLLKWQCKEGDLWRIGEHRLLCGDCTDKATVARLFGDNEADLTLTDPPYGVSYADKNKFFNEIGKGNHVQTEIENDHMSIDDIKPLWLGAFTNALNSCHDKASFYSFMPQGGDQMMMMMMMISEAGWMPKHELIWLKNNHVLGRTDYSYKHEPILYGWKRNGTHLYYGGFQTSIFEFNKPLKSEFHPTMKPVELVTKLIENSTIANGLVYDPFLGSGTTMVAAQQTGRRCFGLEIAPKYCAVILQRMENLGLTPELSHA